jgi:hypothetical protein
MNHRFTPTPLKGIGALASMVSFLLLLSYPLRAAAWCPEVTSAEPTYKTNPPELTLVGTNFGTVLPVVTIDGLSALVVTHTNTLVKVKIPAAVYAVPGSYDLLLTRGSGECQTAATFDVTIGAVGLQGPAGPIGLTGPAGATGPIGLTGAAGAKGATGGTGPAGPAGATGPNGLTGAAGSVGPAGPTGPTGATGTAGPAGPAGATGPIGLTGAAGSVGPAGPIGLQGATGSAGPIGPTGLTGAAGTAGPAGPAGTTGPVGLTGASGTAGPAGLTGTAGTAGATGPTGPAGPAGPVGGLIDFADFYALMPSDNAATVAPSADVSFPENGPALAGTNITSNGSTVFTLGAIGIYEVQFQVSVNEAGQLELTLNGNALAYTVVGRATGTSQIVEMALVQTTDVASTLTVRNPAGNSTALTITPSAGGTSPVSAHLLITRLE